MMKEGNDGDHDQAGQLLLVHDAVEDPALACTASEGCLAEGQMPALVRGGGAGIGEKKSERGTPAGDDNIPPPGHEGGFGKEEKADECPSNEGLVAPSHGDGQDKAKLDQPGDLREIIQNNENDRLIELLGREGAEALLTTTYGGIDDGEDESGLYPGTLPLLHAARRAREDRHLPPTGPHKLGTLLKALERTSRLRSQLVTRDGGGRTVLHLAALSGAIYAFQALLLACRKQRLSPNEMLELLTSRDTATGRTVLMAAATVGSLIFTEVLEATRGALSQDETKLQAELLKKDDEGRTLLHLALDCGAFGTMLDACLSAGLSKTQMLKMLKSRDKASGSTALMAAAGSGVYRTFEDAFHATKIVVNQNENEVKKHLLEEDDRDQTILQIAVLNGNQRTLDAVWNACRELGLKATQMGSRRRIRCAKTELHAAVDTGSVFSFETALRRPVVINAEAVDRITSKNIVGETLLSKAVETGSVRMFEAVHKLAMEVLTPDQLAALVESKNIFGENFLAKAFDNGSVELFEAVLKCAWKSLGHHQLREFIESKDVDGVVSTVAPPAVALFFSRLLLSRALDTKDVGIFEAAVNGVIGRCTSLEGPERIVGMIEELIISRCGSRPIYILMIFLSRLVPLMVHCSSLGQKVSEQRRSEMDFAFTLYVRSTQSTLDEDDLKTLSSLIANSARPSVIALEELSQFRGSGDWFKSFCLRAVTSAVNPLIPGLTLSIQLGEAASRAGEGERRKFTDINSSIEELLLEIFERLPQTVRGFDAEGGMDACNRFFEGDLKPKDKASSTDRSASCSLGGPLDMLVSEQQQLETFCNVPLVMDFLSNKFTLGLPDLLDTEEFLRTNSRLLALRHNGLLPWYRIGSALLMGVGGVPSLTFLPGAQFMAVGVASASSSYYEVPAVRMLLDFVVYVGTIAMLSYFVLFHSTAGSMSEDGGIVDHDFSWVEGTCALIFVTGGVIREGREMKRDIHRYFRDQWNILDALGLLCLTLGIIVRWSDSTSPWGPAFYALSTPLVVSRVLFFAQILQFQGPMIQVIFRMTSTLLQFGAVILVVMIGFAAALHVLFHDLNSFGQTLLWLFKAMLGDTEIFDDFSGGRYDSVATILVVVYLFIVTIMLLNLLIAILSTSHSKVQANAGGAYKVSKARIIAHYQMVVDEDLLPAPFNLVQLFLSLMVSVSAFPSCYSSEAKKDDRSAGALKFWGNVCEAVGERQRNPQKALGLLVFWMVLGPVAVAGGAVLWGLSGFSYAQYVLYPGLRAGTLTFFRGDKFTCVSSRMLQGLLLALAFIVECFLVVIAWFFLFLWCILGAPCALFLRWTLLPRWVFRRVCCFVLCRCCCLIVCRCHNLQELFFRGSSRDRKSVTKVSIERMLRKAPGGVGTDKLRIFLEDPINDNDIRRDEKDRNATVEHLKLLRNRLEAAIKEQVKEQHRIDFSSRIELAHLFNGVASKNEVNNIRHDVANLRNSVEEVLWRSRNNLI